MYLHIGKDVILNKDEILFILDYKKIKDKKNFEKFFNTINNKNIIDISEGKQAKSLIVVQKEKELKGYLSNISSVTLSKRKRLTIKINNRTWFF